MNKKEKDRLIRELEYEKWSVAYEDKLVDGMLDLLDASDVSPIDKQDFCRTFEEVYYNFGSIEKGKILDEANKRFDIVVFMFEPNNIKCAGLSEPTMLTWSFGEETSFNDLLSNDITLNELYIKLKQIEDHIEALKRFGLVE